MQPASMFVTWQVALADLGVSHRLAAAVEGAGESAISAAGRAGTTLTGGYPRVAACSCVPHTTFVL